MYKLGKLNLLVEFTLLLTVYNKKYEIQQYNKSILSNQLTLEMNDGTLNIFNKLISH